MLYFVLTFDVILFSFSEFCGMVRKIFIYTVEEVKRLSPKAKLPPVNSDVKSTKTDSDVAVATTEDQSSVAGQA